jgi:hypothetical protein
MAKVRLEWVRLARQDYARGAVSNDLGEVVGALTLVVSSTDVSTTAAPSFGGTDPAAVSSGFARVTVLSGAVNAAWGDAPTASEALGVRVDTSAPLLFSVTTGRLISLIEAADPPAVLEVQTRPAQVEATSRSATIVAGGAPQDLMPANPVRIGWRIQNQSNAALYLRSKGGAGTMVATADQNSLLIPPGATWTEDAQVTPNALSILGPVTGQAFYAREW